MAKNPKTLELDRVVVRFAGDSGDGMQFTGSQFTFASAIEGNDLATFPDYPAEIRAPKGTLEGVSGFQIQLGKVQVHTPGDRADVLVAMNPAALKSNLKWVKPGGTIIVDTDTFDARNLKKAGYEQTPLDDGSLKDYQVVMSPITSLTKEALVDSGMDHKSISRSRNMFALGVIFWMFNRSLDDTRQVIQKKFAKNPTLAEGNLRALDAGHAFAETIEVFNSNYIVPPAEMPKGKYRHISGNNATAWGLLAAREKLGLTLFYGSYPITPASDILHELARHKHMGVITLQAEDEIAAISSAIGAAYAGQIGVTASSGPGLALKGEALGLAVMTELPIVVIDVQRAGPSTGMPTKTEQGDLFQALYGRNNDSPLIVMAPGSPSDCFLGAFWAVKLAVEHMTPVIMLSDAYLANGSEPWQIPSTADLPSIEVPLPTPPPEGEAFQPYARDQEKLNRYWAAPGMEGLTHRIGGLEKDDGSGNVSYDPDNHQKMIQLRAEKVARVADAIPPLKVFGPDSGDLLVVGWGSTAGSLLTAVDELNNEGESVSHAHFYYLNPLPANTEEVFSRFKRVLVCELNDGQFAAYLRSKFPGVEFLQYNKIQGLPFSVEELKIEIIRQS